MIHKLVIPVARTIFACIAFTGLVGCETFMSAQNAEKFPPTGILVDVDGRKLQIDCRGSGSPTVVLESGGSNGYGSLQWGSIPNDIAESTKVCSYSRAGWVWSDSRDSIDAEGVAQDLRMALRLANAEPPFVMVGHSRGGLYNLIFTDLFRDDVAGLVFVDATPPELEERRAQAGVIPGSSQPNTLAKFGRALRWTGFPRMLSGMCESDLVSEETVDICKAYLPHSLDGFISENSVLASVHTRAAQVNDLGSRPVLVLTRQFKDEWYSTDPAVRAVREKSEAHWRELHREIASWSSRGEQRLVPDSAHNFPFTHPQVVVDGINEIVELVRQP